LPRERRWMVMSWTTLTISRSYPAVAVVGVRNRGLTPVRLGAVDMQVSADIAWDADSPAR
jgi:hypothetical protein